MQTLKAATDPDLVTRARDGDRAAMSALMKRHNQAMFRTARAILRDDTQAEDALQEAWMRAFKSLGSFRGDSSLSTWLIRIAANEALMMRRRGVREAQVFPIDASGDATHAMEEATMPRDEPEQQAQRAEVRRFLEARIDALPDLYRPVFMLRAVEELTVEETAAVLGIPEATVRTRFFRARALMRASIEGHLDQVLEEAFGFDGERCDRIAARVLARLDAEGYKTL
jgi:RNA polymerase sigma-70 factor (ECF subfamily)